MRKKGILLILALAGLFTSCNDAIDITQPGEISNPYEVFRNADDIKRGISGIYISLPGESEIGFTSIFTDEVAIGRDNGGQGLISGEYGFFMQPGTSFANSTWASYYSVINRVNRLINITDKLYSETTVVAERTKLINNKAELLGLRAYANLKLFAYFTPDYTNPSGLSIMKLDFVPKEGRLDEHIGRSTVAQITKFIVDDIDEALTIRPDGWVNENNNYITDQVLNAFKVKLYAMTENYTELIPLAQSVLDNYRFATGPEYVSMFAFNPAEPSSEIIWKLARPLGSGGNVAENWYSSQVDVDGSFFYEMGRSLYNELDKLDPAVTGEAFGATRVDVRYSVNLQATSEVAVDYASLPQFEYVNKDLLLIGKFEGKQGAFPAALKNDIPIIRYADIALLLAEARAAQGQIAMTSTDPMMILDNYSTVGNIIANLRLNRSIPALSFSMPVITDVNSAWKAILDERRVEFAFEGHRYLDMKRLGRKAGSPGFQRYAKDCIVNGTCAGLAADSYKLTLPIPNSELNANPIIRGQQNPGY